MNTRASETRQSHTGDTPWVSFGIHSFHHPVAGHMDAGQVYCLLTDIPSIRFPLLNSTIANWLVSGMNCSVIMASRPDVYLEQLCTPPRFNVTEALDRRLINVFMMQEEFQKKLFQIGVERMLDELDRFGVEYGSLIVFDHANALLNLYDLHLATQQLDAIGTWARRHGLTVLMVFSQNQNVNSIDPRALLDSMNGMATLNETSDGLQLGFPFWRFRGNVATGVSFRVELDSSGEYRATPHSRLHSGSPEVVDVQNVTENVYVSRSPSEREFEGRNSPSVLQPIPARISRARRTADEDFHLSS